MTQAEHSAERSQRRIIHQDGRRGVQLEDNGYGGLLIRWGSVDRRDITEWVSCHDVVTDPEPGFFGTEAEKNRSLVYNPMDHLR